MHADEALAEVNPAVRTGAVRATGIRSHTRARERAETPRLHREPGRTRRLARAWLVLALALVVVLGACGKGSEAMWDALHERLRVSPRYSGTTVPVSDALQPLGPDPQSGLEEFAFLPSGACPSRGRAGRLVYCDDSALVLVLLPGGTFWMGAQAVAPEERNYDPDAQSTEGPVREVRVAACLVAKHEVTQAQWSRLTGLPSQGSFSDDITVGRRPMDGTSYDDARAVLLRNGLQLPTEEQWEYAYRAGTATPWWWGAGESEGAVREWVAARSLADGPHVVGTRAPNGFGLQDMAGNVGEWCACEVDLDPQSLLLEPQEVGVASGKLAKVCGGAYYWPLKLARATSRVLLPRDVDPVVGVRPVMNLGASVHP